MRSVNKFTRGRKMSKNHGLWDSTYADRSCADNLAFNGPRLNAEMSDGSDCSKFIKRIKIKDFNLAATNIYDPKPFEFRKRF